MEEVRKSPLPRDYQIHLLVNLLLVLGSRSLGDQGIQAEQETHVDKQHGHHTDDENYHKLKKKPQQHSNYVLKWHNTIEINKTSKKQWLFCISTVGISQKQWQLPHTETRGPCATLLNISSIVINKLKQSNSKLDKINQKEALF